MQLNAIQNLFFVNVIQAAAWPSGSERCFDDSHDRKVNGSTPTQASLLRPWIRCFTTLLGVI